MVDAEAHKYIMVTKVKCGHVVKVRSGNNTTSSTNVVRPILLYVIDLVKICHPFSL